EVEEVQARADQRVLQPRARLPQRGAGVARMGGKRDRLRAGRLQTVVQLVGEEEVRQLRLLVCGRRAVARLGLQVVEANDAAFVGNAADGDDPGAGPCEQPGEEKSSKGEVSKVIRGERQLEPGVGPLV